MPTPYNISFFGASIGIAKVVKKDYYIFFLIFFKNKDFYEFNWTKKWSIKGVVD